MAPSEVSLSDTGSGPDVDAQPTATFVAAAQPMATRTESVSPSRRGPDSGAAQPASAPGGAAQPTRPVVAIDVGDVASKRNDDQRVEGSKMYTAVEDGFWAFVVLFAAEFGLQDMHLGRHPEP